MRFRVVIIVVAAVGFSAGFLVVREVSAMPAEGVESARPTGSKSRTGGSRVSSSPQAAIAGSSSGGKHDFATLVRNASRILAKLSPVNRELERMDTGELKALVVELAATLKEQGPPEQMQAASSVQRAAAAKLYQREGTAALDWAAGIAAGEGGKGILSAILSEVTKDNPQLGKEWIQRYRGEYGEGWAKDFTHQAIVGANGRGAEDMLKVIELFKDDLRGIKVTQGTFAEDFDFHRLITGQPAGFDFSDAVAYWAARDKEAAWAAVDEVIKSGAQRGTTYFGSLLRGIVTLEGDERAAAWTMDKLGEIPAASRQAAIRSLVMYPLPGPTVAALVRAMPDENDRVFFASELALPFRAASALGALQALGSEDLQVKALVRSAEKQAGYAARGNAPSTETLGFFATTMDQLQFTPASREQVKNALPPLGETSSDNH